MVFAGNAIIITVLRPPSILLLDVPIIGKHRHIRDGVLIGADLIFAIALALTELAVGLLPVGNGLKVGFLSSESGEGGECG